MKKLSLALVFMLLMALNAYAVTYYVAKTGSNSNSCTAAQSAGTAKLTITAGMTCLQSSGDTLIIKGGTYAESLLISVPSGSDSNYTTIKGETGETVWVRPTSFVSTSAYDYIVQFNGPLHHILIQNIGFDGSGYPNDGFHSTRCTNMRGPGISDVNRTHHLVFDNIRCTAVRGDAIEFRSTNSSVLRNSHIYGTLTSGGADASGSAGVYSQDNAAGTPGQLIENNLFENNLSTIGGNGINLSGNNNTTVRNNIVQDYALEGCISFKGTNSGNLLVYNNICINNYRGILFANIDEDLNIEVYNNTIFGTTNSSAGECIRRGNPREAVTSAMAAKIKNNICWDLANTDFQVSGNFYSEPLFVNEATRDLRLQSGSNAVNSGTTIAAVPNDFNGVNRPQPPGGNYDHGAYEFIASVPQTPYLGTAWPAPGTIQAENYDVGGSGVAYVDTTAGNTGGVYRTDDVDIETTIDTGGGYKVGFVKAGEWLEYTLNVATTGTYDIETRVSALGNGGTFNYSVDGGAPTATQTVPNTGAWTSFQTISTPISLTAGTRILRLSFLTDGTTTFGGYVGNFNWIKLDTPVVTLPSPVAHYKFEGDATDETGNHHGTIVGAPTFPAGKIGQSILLDGTDDYVTTSKAFSVFMSASTGAIAAWVKPTGTVPSNSFEWALPAVVADDSGYLGINWGNKTGTAPTGNRLWIYNYDAAYHRVGATYTIDQWSHIVFVHSAGTLYLYKDGALSASIASGATEDMTGLVGIGKTDISGFFRGEIDEVRLYNVALDAAQVTELHLVDDPPPPIDTTAPTDPSNLTATGVSSSQIRLTWTGSTDEGGDGVSHYEIERCEGAACETWAEIDTVGFGALSYGDATGLTASALYRYRIRAVDNATNESGYSNIAETNAVDETPPDIPSDLGATTISASQIDLAWTGSTDVDGSGVLHYEIERAPGPACDTWAEIDTVLDGTLTYSNTTGLSASTAYCYRVRAEDNETNVSNYSDIAEATTSAAVDETPPTDPSNLVATTFSSGQINLTWTASTDIGGSGISHYEIERREDGGAFAQIYTTIFTTHSDVDNLVPSTLYEYRVRAVDLAETPNLSAYSNIDGDTTSAAPGQSVFDTFDGTASPLGPPWTDEVFGAGTGGCEKVAGVMENTPGSNLAGCYITETFPANQDVFATAINPETWANNTGAYLLGCLQAGSVGTSGADGYTLRLKTPTGGGNDELQFYRYTDTGLIAISDKFVREFVTGDSWKMEIIAGGTLNGYYRPSGGEWTLALTTTDTTYTCEGSHVGVNLRHSSQKLDDFSANELFADPPSVPIEFPVHPVLDEFTRANNADPGANWTEPVFGDGGCQISSNTLLREGPGTQTGCYWSAAAFEKNQEVYARLPAASTHADGSLVELLLCGQNLGGAQSDGYVLRLQSFDASVDKLTLMRVDSGAYTAINPSIDQVVSNNDWIGMLAQNNGEFEIFYQSQESGWQSLATRGNSDHACDNTAIGALLMSDTQAVDSFGGGGPVFESSLSPPFMMLEFK